MKGIRVQLICVGKMREKFYIDAAAEYVKRLSAYCKLQVVELPEERLPSNPSQAQIDAALEKEAAAIRAKLAPGASLVALCVEGRMRSSEELSGLLSDWSSRGEAACPSSSAAPTACTPPSKRRRGPGCPCPP